MLVVVIVACEVLFWVFLVAGLSARYLLRRPRLGAVLLALSPAADLVLLGATALDLRGGATATFAHGLAAIYLGFSLAYGRTLIRWADVRFAHRFAGGDAPRKKYGMEYARACWLDVARSALAVAITAAVLGRASLFGGKGRVWRSFMGAVFLAMIANGLVLAGVPAFYQQVAVGLLLLFALLLDRFGRDDGRS